MIDPHWQKIRKLARLADVRFHDLRHTYASHAVIKRVTIPMVSKLLGHRKTSMTLRYTHVTDKETEAAARFTRPLKMGSPLYQGQCLRTQRGTPAIHDSRQSRRAILGLLDENGGVGGDSY